MTDQQSADREYTTVEGDTLTLVALRHYGPDAKGEWERIFDANAEVLHSNPWYLAPGTVLRIPPLTEERPPKKAMLGSPSGRDPLSYPSPFAPLPPVMPRERVPDDIRMAAMLIEGECRRAMELHGPMRSGHEGKAVIEEELDELWDEIKKYPKHDPAKWRKEAIHIGAMALRFIVDLKLLYVSHPPED